MAKRSQVITVELPRLAFGLISAVLGMAVALVILSVVDQGTAAVGATIATSIAVIVALGAGLVPLWISQNDRETRSVVVATRIAHDLQRALTSAETIRDGIGYVAETADAKRIKESAIRCLPAPPETIDETFERIGSLSRKDALIVCAGAMAAIAQYEGVNALANAGLEEHVEAFRMQIVHDNNGVVPVDLDSIARLRLGKLMMQYARHAALRAMDAQVKVPAAIAVLRGHGAVFPPPYRELFESPVPEVAADVQAGKWPPQVSN